MICDSHKFDSIPAAEGQPGTTLEVPAGEAPPPVEWLLGMLSVFGGALFSAEGAGEASSAGRSMADEETAPCAVSRESDAALADLEPTWPWLSEREYSLLMATAAAASPEPGAPGRLGRFLLLRELGRGGFGIVFQAVDPTLSRLVALKVARAETMASEKFRSRFARESKAAARLDHPNLVPVYEVGEAEGVDYIAMPYVEGVTLAHWLHSREGPVPFRHAAGLILRVAEAVQHAHERGVLHRDLKPKNILLQPGPVGSADDPGIEPRVCDFGLAKVAEWGADETAWHVQIGSPPYMSPEQIDGSLGPLGPASDIYALGVILYELLAGRPPYRAETRTETLRQVIQDAPEPPSRRRPGTPRDLEAICLKCLEKLSDRRYPTAAALAGDLKRFLAGEPTVAGPVSRWAGVARSGWRHPAHAALYALIVSAVAAQILYIKWLRESKEELAKAVWVANQDAGEAYRQAWIALEQERAAYRPRGAGDTYTDPPAAPRGRRRARLADPRGGLTRDPKGPRPRLRRRTLQTPDSAATTSARPRRGRPARVAVVRPPDAESGRELMDQQGRWGAVLGPGFAANAQALATGDDSGGVRPRHPAATAPNP
jgi:tRNA A-37 threonylcarbamoyl transferase component Bud32